MRKLRQPAPSRPAFANDGQNLNLENHDMLMCILKHKLTHPAQPLFREPQSREQAGPVPLPQAIFS